MQLLIPVRRLFVPEPPPPPAQSRGFEGSSGQSPNRVVIPVRSESVPALHLFRLASGFAPRVNAVTGIEPALTITACFDLVGYSLNLCCNL